MFKCMRVVIYTVDNCSCTPPPTTNVHTKQQHLPDELALHLKEEQGCSHEIWSGTVAGGGDTAEGSGIEVPSGDMDKKNAIYYPWRRSKKKIHLQFNLVTPSCFELKEASLSNYWKPSISSSVNCGHVAASRSAGCTAEFVNIGRSMVVASKSGRVETRPTRPVTTALKSGRGRPWILSHSKPYYFNYSQRVCVVSMIRKKKGIKCLY